MLVTDSYFYLAPWNDEKTDTSDKIKSHNDAVLVLFMLNKKQSRNLKLGSHKGGYMHGLVASLLISQYLPKIASND